MNIITLAPEQKEHLPDFVCQKLFEKGIIKGWKRIYMTYSGEPAAVVGTVMIYARNYFDSDSIAQDEGTCHVLIFQNVNNLALTGSVGVYAVRGFLGMSMIDMDEVVKKFEDVNSL